MLKVRHPKLGSIYYVPLWRARGPDIRCPPIEDFFLREPMGDEGKFFWRALMQPHAEHIKQSPGTKWAQHVLHAAQNRLSERFAAKAMVLKGP
jgi:hypothetical protein